MNRIPGLSLLVCLVLVPALGLAQGPAPGRLENLTHGDVKNLDVRVLVLPIGSCEPHGYHLPYANDTWIAEALAAQAAAKANSQGAKVLVLPVLPYGVNVNLADLPRAQSMRPSTMIAFVTDAVDTAERQGIRKFVIINSHGGNSAALATALRELFASHPKVFVSLMEPFSAWADEQRRVFQNPGGHAGEAETAVSLALFPDKVRMERAVAPRPGKLKLETARQIATFVQPWRHISDTTGQGDPKGATAANGRKLVDYFVEQASRFLVELSAAEVTDSFPY